MGLSAFDPTVALQQGKSVLAPYLAPSSLSSWNVASQGSSSVRPIGTGGVAGNVRFGSWRPSVDEKSAAR
jgi:hypothetical protein